MTNELLTATQLAEYLKMKPVTVRRKAKRGEIPSIRVGNRLRFDRQQIDRWLTGSSSGAPMQVLVVDDEPLVGELFKDSLKGPSYRITTTLSSREALELAGNKHFDVVFLDLLMPEIDGAEVFRQMRQMGVSASVVIITSYPDGDLMDRATQHGPLMVMRKPFTSGVILEAIRSVLPGEETRA